MARAHGSSAVALRRIVQWYADVAHGRWEGAGTTPHYCDPARVGPFAVDATALAAGDDDALFQLFVTLAMYQSRRDVDVMDIQRTMPARAARSMIQPKRLAVLVEDSPCARLDAASTFDAGCDVYRELERGRTSCKHRPRTRCHVKDATTAIGRMGSMGKLASSAWLHLRDDGGGLNAQLARIGADRSPSDRADAMITYLVGFCRVGIKLATMFVSAIATPALAPGLTPWWPRVDANHLVVVDANVGRVVDALRPRGSNSYTAQAGWFRRIATTIDLRRIDRRWPRTSPRLVQQAAYVFRSRSNRSSRADPCATLTRPCARCVPSVCPFAGRMDATRQPR